MTHPLRQTDYGLFGPDSPSWKVWASPTALLGFQRSVVLEHFDPFLAAAVADAAGIYTDPHSRLDGTLSYFLTVAVADSRTAIRASEHLMTIHAKATGIEPISGKRYAANNPKSQLWIHVTGWHSVLKCYEVYGPGRLSPEEEARYWQECVVAAELQTCDPADVPRSREQVRAYFAKVRPTLCTSERAAEAMHYLLRTPASNAGMTLWGSSRLMAPAVIATLPKWMRQLGEFNQPAALDATVKPVMRAAMSTAAKPAILKRILPILGPRTAQVFSQHLEPGEPAARTTRTPTEARARYGRHTTTA
ncbi:oxygenase MpaB family protein [Nocardia gipuzkoensis]|uniref:oxygenase MpaB family protein n=1 Tax=Nocardia gipuzkoensis TaxID=2749991 RepID=UPI001F362ED9|nr:oxygenase MpaB family protein [Nocardia gipuzkoensis]